MPGEPYARAMKTSFDLPTVLTSAGLGAAAAVHLAWARGSTWPRASNDELADLVIGTRPMPPRPASAAVGAALSGAAIGVAVAGHSARGGPVGRIAGLAALITARVLRARGLGGLGMAAAGASTSGADASEEFRVMDVRLYSPLCIGLSMGAARAAKRAKASRVGARVAATAMDA